MKNFLVLSSIIVGSGLMALHPPSSKPNTSVFGKRMTTGNGPVGAVSITIDKSDYELIVYDSKGWYATYPVVFGNNSLDDKKVEGDKNTPEGSFRIVGKKPHDKWDRFLALNYPTAESWEKFNKRKRNGEIPASASIGGGVGIHGTWPHEDFVIDRYKNWTMGCISMKREDVEDLYSYTPIGTPVLIRK